MRVIVTASRSWTNPGRIHHRMGLLLGVRPYGHFLYVIYGDARGGDAIIHQWVQDHADSNVRGERYVADWDTHGKAAGYIRNAQMVDSGAQLCIGFLCDCANPKCLRPKPHGTHGTTHCLDYARKEKIETEVIRWA